MASVELASSGDGSLFRFRRLRSAAVAVGLLLLVRLRAKGRFGRLHAFAWLTCEVAWAIAMRKIIIPCRIRVLRVEDAGTCDALSFDRTVKIAENVLQKDQRSFWRRIARIPSANRVHRETVRSYAKSLLYVNPDADLTGSKQALIEDATNRLELASGAKFKTSRSEENMCIRTCSSLRRRPSTVSGWTDDEILADTVRSTPLVVCAVAELSVSAACSALRLAGWRPCVFESGCGAEAWQYQPKQDTESGTPLVLLPGLACGFVSFLPFALRLQATFRQRRIIFFRWPWAEIGMPLEVMPQWNSLVAGVAAMLGSLGVTSADIIAHSYGTCVANRLIRRLCGLDEEAGFPAPKHGFCKIRSATMLEAMIFGDTSAGLSCGFCNELGLDINTATLANRGGVPWKESMFYDPSLYGQCLEGLYVYACDGDMLMDIESTMDFCRKYQPNARFERDSTPLAFHGRFLVELWGGGYWWGAPCLSRVLNLISDLPDKR